MISTHHITGRLRLKFPELKSRRDLSHAVEKAIRALPTVRLVQVNAVTGSVLIHYDARGTQQTILLNAVQDILANQFGLVFSNGSSGKNAANSPHFHSNVLVERMTEMIVEKFVERSALALLGLLI